MQAGWAGQGRRGDAVWLQAAERDGELGGWAARATAMWWLAVVGGGGGGGGGLGLETGNAKEARGALVRSRGRGRGRSKRAGDWR